MRTLGRMLYGLAKAATLLLAMLLMTAAAILLLHLLFYAMLYTFAGLHAMLAWMGLGAKGLALTATKLGL